MSATTYRAPDFNLAEAGNGGEKTSLSRRSYRCGLQLLGVGGTDIQEADTDPWDIMQATFGRRNRIARLPATALRVLQQGQRCEYPSNTLSSRSYPCECWLSASRRALR